MANQYLALSLFIMLLSFFIILNSMSDFEEVKADPVLSSLNMAFSSAAVDKERERPSVKITEDVSSQEGNTLDKIKGLFENNITNFKVAQNRFGTEMRIVLSLEEFEQALQSTEELLLSDSADAGENTFLSTLVTLVLSEETGVPYRMDMILATGEEPSVLRNQSPEVLRDYTAKASSFAGFLEGQGLPQRFISTGLAGGEKNQVHLLFRQYEPVTLGLNERAQDL
ncbi:MAG: hypothetical protein ACLFR0_00175 [Alphaproteobacteria bacterium]